jgi:hypothetical protein
VTIVQAKRVAAMSTMSLASWRGPRGYFGASARHEPGDQNGNGNQSASCISDQASLVRKLLLDHAESMAQAALRMRVPAISN